MGNLGGRDAYLEWTTAAAPVPPVPNAAGTAILGVETGIFIAPSLESEEEW